MDDATGLAEALLGLDGFRVLGVEETRAEVIVTVETAADIVGCSTCGTRAEAQDRVRVDIRDLPCFGRPARLVWMKRRWRCADADCEAKTWTEGSDHVPPRAVITRRAGMESTRQVGELGRSVAEVARELGVCWWTIMDAVLLHGTPLVDDPSRVGPVRAMGIDETNYQAATREHPTIYATGLVDLDRRRLIDMVEGNAARDLRRWLSARIRPGSRPSGWWQPTSPSTTGPACPRTSITPCGWQTPSMWSGSGTVASTRCRGCEAPWPARCACGWSVPTHNSAR